MTYAAPGGFFQQHHRHCYQRSRGSQPGPLRLESYRSFLFRRFQIVGPQLQQPLAASAFIKQAVIAIESRVPFAGKFQQLRQACDIGCEQPLIYFPGADSGLLGGFACEAGARAEPSFFSGVGYELPAAWNRLQDHRPYAVALPIIERAAAYVVRHADSATLLPARGVAGGPRAVAGAPLPPLPPSGPRPVISGRARIVTSRDQCPLDIGHGCAWPDSFEKCGKTFRHFSIPGGIPGVWGP